ncbi:hypothetical protein LCGC14_2375100 [marine sediment metagenome]|uniref:Uncharacterized protein n=1 Tax=marine sediment metagenome TaxID=412755 RepID=A0A0F9CPU9_9ZZZZ
MVQVLETARPGVTVRVIVRLDRGSHVSRSSHVEPPSRYPLTPPAPG